MKQRKKSHDRMKYVRLASGRRGIPQCDPNDLILLGHLVESFGPLGAMRQWADVAASRGLNFTQFSSAFLRLLLVGTLAESGQLTPRSVLSLSDRAFSQALAIVDCDATRGIYPDDLLALARKIDASPVVAGGHA